MSNFPFIKKTLIKPPLLFDNEVHPSVLFLIFFSIAFVDRTLIAVADGN
jgi:hypothetical protein